MGRLVAQALGATFSDVDECIERDERQSVTRIFAERGEAAFRTTERVCVESLLAATPGVIAPGGGWAAQQGGLESLKGRGFAVHLDTTPDEASRRVASHGHRPLLAGGEPDEKMRGLSAARRAFYERADAVVKTDARTPEEVALEVVALARSAGGW